MDCCAQITFAMRRLMAVQGVSEQVCVMRLVRHLVSGPHKPSDSGALVPGACAIYAVLEVCALDPSHRQLTATSCVPPPFCASFLT